MSQLERAEIGVTQAIAVAKQYVSEIFAGDGVVNVGLEEVSYDEGVQTYEITIGFSREWDQSRIDHPAFAAMDMLYGSPQLPRTYKIVYVSSKDGTVLKVTNRGS